MRLLFKQRLFSWLDSYDIYDEAGNTRFTVKGKLSFGHCLEIYDRADRHVGTVKEEVFSFLPRFVIYIEGQEVGHIRKELSLFKPVYSLDCKGWEIQGDFFEWDYSVSDPFAHTIMTASKQLFNWTDTYVIDVEQEEHVLLSLMIVLAIDAVKCSKQ